MSGYAAGRRVEWLVRDDLAAARFEVFRTAGSKGIVDLIGIRAGLVALVQVKRTQAQIPPAKRRALLALADLVGYRVGLPIVATKPDRQPIGYRLLTGPGPNDHRPWSPEVAP